MEYNTHVKTPKMQHLKTTACFCKQDDRLVKFIIFLTEINILVYGRLECLLKYIFLQLSVYSILHNIIA